MKKSRKPIKGVRYVANVLKTYQKSKFSSYRAALPEARRIVAELKATEQKVNIKNIWSLSRDRKRGRPKKEQVVAPEPYFELLQPKWYFEFESYPLWIQRSTNKIWFTSKLFPSDKDAIQGGSLPNYYEYFGRYVTFCNKVTQETERSRYEDEFRIVCNPPVQNPAKNNRWECEIISVAKDGKTEIDYGFNPNNPDVTPDRDNPNAYPSEPTEPKPPTPPTPTPSAPTPAEPSKPSEPPKSKIAEFLEAQKRLEQNLKDNLITKEQYQEILLSLSRNLKAGGNL